MGNRWEALNLRLLPVVPDQIYAVAERYGSLTQDFIGIGEILMAADDTDRNFEFPFRYREGVFSALRAAHEIELGLPSYDPRRALEWLKGTSPVHQARGRKVRHWQKTLHELIQLVLNYVRHVRAWADQARTSGHYGGAVVLANQLRVLTYRPFVSWFRVIETSLHASNLDLVVNYCDLILARAELEPIMFRLSHTLHHVERFREAHIRASALLPDDVRAQFADQLDQAYDQIGRLGDAIDYNVERALSPLRTTAKMLKEGQVREAKLGLETALKAFDYLPPLPLS